MTSSQERSLSFIDDIEQYDVGDGAEEGILWSKNTEQEDVLDWVSGIGSGAAQGAAMGATAGPWGALIGGLTGAGLGAVQTASQQQRRDGPAAPPQGAQPPVTATQPRPPDQALSPPSPPVSPSPAPSAAGPTTAGKVSGISPQLIQQLLQLLPLLTQVLAQQSRATVTGGAGAESEDGQDNGDYVPDAAFMAGEGPYHSGNGESPGASEVAVGGRAREEESLWDWIVQAGRTPHTAEWTQEGSSETAPTLEWSIDSLHFVWEG